MNLVAFGDTLNCNNTRHRFKQQAIDMNIFENIHILNEHDIDKHFINLNYNFIKYGTRGFGYWIWKPQVILQTLEKMHNNDYLLYCDIGCSFNKNKIERLKEYIDITDDILCFEVIDAKIKEFTKMDTIKYILPEIDVNLDQICATSILFKKTDIVIKLLKEWIEMCCVDNYRLVDDSKSVFPNDEHFKDHRHDQAIFNLLVRKYKKEGVINPVILKSEIDNYENYPINASRLKY